jgi:hypothetical protein
MARLYIELPPSLKRREFLNSLPAETRKLGETLVDAGYGFIDFLLGNTQETLQEKVQIVNTLTDNYVAFYSGQDAPTFIYSGVVLNTYQDDQRVWLLKLYRDVLRGTRLAQRDLVASLRYDSFIVRGYLEALSLGLNANINTAGTFQFNMRVKEMVIDSPALALPTIDYPNGPGSLPSYADISPQQQDTLRAATLTTEVPPTAVAGPAASQNALTAVNTDPFSFNVQPQTTVPVTDEVQQHVERITSEAIATINTSALATNSTVQPQFAGLNPSNVHNDGAGGLTNIKNAPPETQASVSPVVKIPPRTRGVKKVAPAQRAQLS